MNLHGKHLMATNGRRYGSVALCRGGMGFCHRARRRQYIILITEPSGNAKTMTPLRENPACGGAARPAKLTERGFNYHQSC